MLGGVRGRELIAPSYSIDEVTTDEQTTSKLVVQESIVDAILRMWV